MTTSATTVTTKIRLCAGKKSSWENDSHDFLTFARGRFPKSSHDDFDIRAYLNRADPALLKAGKVAMSGADLAKFEQNHPRHVEEANDTAYEILTSMFRSESPAYTFIRSKAASGAIPIGMGFDLYEALIKWATRGKTATRTSSQKVRELTKLALRDNEDIDDYIERFERLLLQLSAQDPPQTFPEALKMQWLVNGLPTKFEKVIDKSDRENYSDLDALQDAITTEADILADKEEASPSVLDVAAAATGGVAKLTKGQRWRRNKAAKKSAANGDLPPAGDSGLAADGATTQPATDVTQTKNKGKGKSKPPTNLQCFRCWGFGHLARDCPSLPHGDAAAAAWGQDTRHWCPFHNKFVKHTPDVCSLNPASANYRGKGSTKGKGYGRGGNKGKGSTFPSSYVSTHNGKGGGGGYGRGYAAVADTDADDWHAPNVYDSLHATPHTQFRFE